MPQPEVDPTTMMLGALKRRVSIWEQMLASPGVPTKVKQQMADEILYLFSAMTELAEKPAAQPGANGSSPPPAPAAKDATGSTSSPLTAEDQAEFDRIRQRRANPEVKAETNGGHAAPPADTPPPEAVRAPAPAPTLGKNVTGSTSSPLTAEDLAEFERIRQKRGTPVSQP